jgi:hypothetical protein
MGRPLSRPVPLWSVLHVTLIAFAPFVVSQIRIAPPTPVQQYGSTAWSASFWFWAPGGRNLVSFGATNLGSIEVTVCYSILRGERGEEAGRDCTSPVRPGGTVTWSFTQEQLRGFAFNILLYARGGAAPISPLGYLSVDVDLDNSPEGILSLPWIPAAAP